MTTAIRLFRVCRLACGILAGVLLLPAPARAECMKLPFSVTQPIVERFIFNEQTLLRDSPRGGDGLMNATGVLAMVSRATPVQIMKVARQGSADQRTAIGAGLGIAASRCKQREPQVTLTLEKLVRESSDSIIQRAFAEKLKFNGVLSDERASLERSRSLRDQLAKTAKPEDHRRTFNIKEPGATGPIRGIADIPPVQNIPPIQPLR